MVIQAVARQVAVFKREPGLTGRVGGGGERGVLWRETGGGKTVSCHPSTNPTITVSGGCLRFIDEGSWKILFLRGCCAALGDGQDAGDNWNKEDWRQRRYS